MVTSLLNEKRQVMAGTVQNAGGESTIALWEAGHGLNCFGRAELYRLDRFGRMLIHSSLRLDFSGAGCQIVVFHRLIHAASVPTTVSWA